DRCRRLAILGALPVRLDLDQATRRDRPPDRCRAARGGSRAPPPGIEPTRRSDPARPRSRRPGPPVQALAAPELMAATATRRDIDRQKATDEHRLTVLVAEVFDTRVEAVKVAKRAYMDGEEGADYAL